MCLIRCSVYYLIFELNISGNTKNTNMESVCLKKAFSNVRLSDVFERDNIQANN
jgi:hypothetical protein